MGVFVSLYGMSHVDSLLVFFTNNGAKKKVKVL